MEKSSEEKIKELQLIEQNLQQIMMQRQNFQAKLLEMENALEELGKNPGDIYKIVGPIMVRSDKESTEKDLDSKKEMFNLRIKNIEENEEKVKERAKKLQEAIMKEMKDG